MSNRNDAVEFEESETPQVPKLYATKVTFNSAQLLAGKIALIRALPKTVRARSLKTSPIAIVIITPGPDWCGPVYCAARELLGHGVSFDHSVTASEYSGAASRDIAYFVRSAPDRSNRADMSGSAVPGAFARGASVVGIASDISLLPKEVVEAADLTVEIEPLRGADVRKIIYAVIGAKSVPPVDDAISFALTPTQLAAAIRPLSTAAACLTRLRVVAERALKLTLNRDAPPLEDLAGYGEAQIWGMDLKRDIEKRRANRSAISVDMLTRSILLAGVPGVGKTLFAAALAKSCRIPLVETSYGIWQSAGAGHLGDLTVAMRKAFSDAAQAARSNDVGCAVLLIDEVDSIPSRASSASTNENFWWIAVQNAMLTLSERDAPIRRGVILIGATNHPERLDPAFTRPGRIGDRIITISLPDAAEFAVMLRTHVGADLPDVDLQAIGRLASRMTGAEAARIVRDARQVARNAERPLTVADLIGQLLPPETRSQRAP